MANNIKNISLKDASKDFITLTKVVDKEGQVVITKDNKPKYLLINIDQNPILDMSEEEKIEYMGKKVLKKYIKAFKELAKN